MLEGDIRQQRGNTSKDVYIIIEKAEKMIQVKTRTLTIEISKSNWYLPAIDIKMNE